MRFEPLSEKELQLIHDTTLIILQETGAVFEGDEAKDILLSAGCLKDGRRLLFPPRLVEDCLDHQVAVSLYGVDESIVMPLTEATQSYTHNFGSVSVLLDPHDHKIREALLQDLIDFVRISDSLTHPDMVVPSLRPTDLPEEIASLAMTAYTLQNTVKPVDIGTASDRWEISYLIRIAAAVRGGLQNLVNKPMGTLSISPLSPLNFPADITEAIIESARSGLPITMLPCPTRGLTAPITLAGGLVQQNAEQLAFLVLARLVNNKTPLVYTCRLAGTNMRTGCVSGRDPDIGFSGACTAQLARYYGLPSGVYGLDTGSAQPDLQSGFERAINGLYPVLAGATLVSGIGALNAGLLASAEQLVIDDEIYAMIMHRQKGIVVSEEAIGAEVISAVMRGGHFLAQEHTRNYMRKGEIYTGTLGNEAPYEEWRATGSVTIREQAGEKINQLLADHRGVLVSETVCLEIESILAEAKAEKMNAPGNKR